MDKNAEQLAQQIFSWLSCPTDVNSSFPADDSHQDWNMESLDFFTWEEDLETVRLHPNKPVSPPELSLGQHRYETLLKQKLKAEIEHCPSHFPWETEGVNDDAEDVAQKARLLQ
jgi:hypothetical protein